MLEIINRSGPLFLKDFEIHKSEFSSKIKSSRILVVGGGGSIGRSTASQIFKFQPSELVLVDISENNLVETIRHLRSSIDNATTKLRSFALDVNSLEFDAFCNESGGYDYILNFSALKHVRSESNPFSISRMIDVNIFNAVKLAHFAERCNSKNYFCVSTDKAANPENIMGASKRIMELFLLKSSLTQNISFARFANVAFSEGSLLYGFKKRIEAKQPLSAPHDVQRFFVTLDEAGLLCLFSCIMGKNRDIFFPKLTIEENGTSFKDIAVKFLASQGYEAIPFASEMEAKKNVSIIKDNKWPCYFFESDTTGEKPAEEFYTSTDIVDWEKYKDVGVISNEPNYSGDDLEEFIESVEVWRNSESWKKRDIVQIFQKIVPNFKHEEKNKYLDEKM